VYDAAMECQKSTEQEKCLAKLTWKSHEEARAAAAYAAWQYGENKPRPRPYHCRICNNWHLAQTIFEN
jgi:hypothetical protein